MKTNINKTDRIIRILLAVIIVLAWRSGVFSSGVSVALLSVAAILIATSLINFCPLYALFGISTLKKKRTTYED